LLDIKSEDIGDLEWIGEKEEVAQNEGEVLGVGASALGEVVEVKASVLLILLLHDLLARNGVVESEIGDRLDGLAIKVSSRGVVATLLPVLNVAHKSAIDIETSDFLLLARRRIPHELVHEVDAIELKGTRDRLVVLLRLALMHTRSVSGFIHCPPWPFTSAATPRNSMRRLL